MLRADAGAGEPRCSERCEIALEVFCHRLSRALCGLAASLDRVDAIVFSGGIGENAALVRERVVGQLAILGARVDAAKNAVHGAGTDGCISMPDSVPVHVIPTNEELMIAREAADAIAG